MTFDEDARIVAFRTLPQGAVELMDVGMVPKRLISHVFQVCGERGYEGLVQFDSSTSLTMADFTQMVQEGEALISHPDAVQLWVIKED